MPNADRLIQIFTEANARPAGAERDGFLAEACGDDIELREQVVALLQSHQNAGDFLKARVFPPALFVTEKPGDTIGRYTLLEKLGEGGCGVVYVAEQITPVRRRVALKVIKLGMDTRQVIARFEAERQALAMMDHSHIAKVLDAGATDAGRPYFVMELVRGVTITDYCDENQLSVKERLALFIQVCHAIQHAHQKGVIHRDIKPSNILVTLHDGVPVPKVIDFGIAKATEGRLTDGTVYTQFLQFVGTPAYMSPEQAELSGLDIDTRSDIYSLGVLLYELLTGEPPFNGQKLVASGLDQMRKTIRETEPTRPSAKLRQTLVADDRRGLSVQPAFRVPNSAIASDLDWIVMKCLEKNRTRRYETANGLARDLERHLHNEPVLARPPTNAYRAQKAFRRNKTAFITGSAVTVALLVALISLLVNNVRITRERNEKDAALLEKATALGSSQASEGRFREQLFKALCEQARASRYSGQPGQRFNSLAALTEAAKIRRTDDLRDEATATMAVPDIRIGESWNIGINADQPLAFDHLYQRYAKISEKGVISVRRVPDDLEIRRLPFTEGSVSQSAQALWFSRTGKFLAHLDGARSFRVWRLAAGELVFTVVLDAYRGMSFSPDERYIVVGNADSILRFDLSQGVETNRWPVPSAPNFLAFHPDSRQLAISYAASTSASVYDTQDGRLIADLRIGVTGNRIAAWHPDGKRLALSGADPRIQIWDVHSKQMLARLSGHAELVTSLTFHPDGSLLASGSSDGRIRLWDPASGRQLLQMPVGAEINFSSDGRWLGHLWPNQGQVRLLEVATSPEYRTLVSNLGPGRDTYFDGGISPDGAFLALGMEDGSRLWDLSTGCEAAFLPGTRTCSAFFNPDGRELFTCGPDAGFQRWVLEEGPGSKRFRLGPPSLIPLPFEKPLRASVSSNGRTLAAVSEEHGLAQLVNLGTGLQGDPLVHRAANTGVLSPNGELMVTGGWHTKLTRLWNSQTGLLLREWTNIGAVLPYFTPDSRKLIISTSNGFALWDVDSFQMETFVPVQTFLYPRRCAMNGQLIALETAPGVIQLRDIATQKLVAKLIDPSTDSPTWMSFTPDGTQLVVVAHYSRVIHVWNLRAIRTRLKAMDLDWDWPEFPPDNTEREPHSRFADARTVQIITASP